MRVFFALSCLIILDICFTHLIIGDSKVHAIYNLAGMLGGTLSMLHCRGLNPESPVNKASDLPLEPHCRIICFLDPPNIYHTLS